MGTSGQIGPLEWHKRALHQSSLDKAWPGGRGTLFAGIAGCRDHHHQDQGVAVVLQVRRDGPLSPQRGARLRAMGGVRQAEERGRQRRGRSAALAPHQAQGVMLNRARPVASPCSTPLSRAVGSSGASCDVLLLPQALKLCGAAALPRPPPPTTAWLKLDDPPP